MRYNKDKLLKIRNSTATEHLINIFKEGELEENSVCREFRHTEADVNEYNIVSIGDGEVGGEYE